DTPQHQNGDFTFAANVAAGTTQVTLEWAAVSAQTTSEMPSGTAVTSPQTIALTGDTQTVTLFIRNDEASLLNVYTINITRAAMTDSINARLSDLVLSGIDIGMFDSGTTSYTARVAHNVNTTAVTATANDGSSGSIFIASDPDDSMGIAFGQDGSIGAGNMVALAVGENVITIVITAENRVSMATYTVTVIRAEQPAILIVPSGVTASAGDGAIAVGWGIVDLSATGYQICVHPGASLNEAMCTGGNVEGALTGAAARSHDFTGLTNGIAYAVAVRANYTNGDSAWVASTPPSVTPTASPTPPPTPTLPTLTIAADQPIFIEGEDASADFTVTSTPAPSDDLPVVVTLTGATTFITGTRTQTITIMATTRMATASFLIEDNDDVDTTETATATLSENAAAYQLGMSEATEMIQDDESDATLSAISLGTGIALTPTFDPGATEYTVRVTRDVSSITVTPTPTISRVVPVVEVEAPATVVRNVVTFDPIEEGEDGSNVFEITITVTSLSGAINTYTVTVTRTVTRTVTEVAALVDQQAVVDSTATLARVFTDISNTTIATRIGQVASAPGGLGGNGSNFNFARSLSQIIVSQSQAVEAGHDFGQGMKDLLDGSIIALPLSGGDEPGMPALWISGDYRDLGSGEGGTDWDGDIVSLQIGADSRLANGMLAGAAVAMTESNIDYTSVDGHAGEQEANLTSVHPYLGWRAAGLDLWASAAYGSGELERNADDADVGQRTDDIGLVGVGFGGNGQLAHFGSPGALRVKGEVSASRMTVEKGMVGGSDIVSDVNLMRIGIEWSDMHANHRGEALHRGIELGARRDGGDGLTGNGVEIGFNLSYDNTHGMMLAGRGRALLAHSADYDEWGVSALAIYAPGADGQGFSLRMDMAYGRTESSASQLWSENAANLADTQPLDPGARMGGKIGYGFAFGDSMLTPYGGFGLSPTSRDLRFGGRLIWRNLPFDMKLEAYLRRQDVATTNSGILLGVGMTW
ncbi:MAG: cadherin-like beta sandwich domain-containing protein, partial [bacterium]